MNQPLNPAPSDMPVTIRRLMEMQDVVGERTIRAALESGELPGRLVGGSVGYITTWSAFLRWAEGRPAAAEKPATDTTGGVDG